MAQGIDLARRTGRNAAAPAEQARIDEHQPPTMTRRSRHVVERELQNQLRPQHSDRSEAPLHLMPEDRLQFGEVFFWQPAHGGRNGDEAIAGP